MIKPYLVFSRCLGVVAVACVGLVLAGCGSSSKATNTLQTGTAATTTTPVATSAGSSDVLGSGTSTLPGVQSGATSTVQKGSLSGGSATTTHTTTTSTSHTTTTTSHTTTTTKSGNTTTKTKTKVIVHNHTKTITRTLVLGAGGVVASGQTAKLMNYEIKGMPAGAFAPVANIVVANAFRVPGKNITCLLTSTGPQCAIYGHSWPTPSGLRNCANNGVEFRADGSDKTRLVCVAAGLSYPRGNEIAPGTDVISTVGNVICQVRSAGVACFVYKAHGFTISRTGFLTY